MIRMNPSALHWGLAQIIILAVISAAFIAMAPDTWRYHPDSSVYIASAVSMADEGRYWFNGYPNLLYYPGLSTLLYLPVKIWGMNFQILHLVSALLGVASLWIVRSYFTAERYGWAGLLLPLLLASNALVIRQMGLIMSDLPFIGISIAALWTWRRYQSNENYSVLLGCAALVAFASLLRFQGLFLIGAFGLALIAHFIHKRDAGIKGFLALSLAGALSAIPFILWTARNYVLFTPDTYNMAAKFFFGQVGIAISEPGWGAVDWIDAAWKYPIYQAMTLFGSLTKTFMNDVHEWMSLEIKSVIAVGLLAAGFLPWLRRATAFEAIYVVTSLAFILKDSIGGTSLYIPERYWMPMLPFAAVIAGLGLTWLYKISASAWTKGSIIAASGIAVMFILVSGTLSWSNAVSRENTDQWATKMESVERVAQQIRETTDADSVLLSTDWGIMPLLTNRHSFQVARSKCSGTTLLLMDERRPDFLVEMPGLLRSKIVERLIDGYPELFELQFETGSRENGDHAALYRINLEQLPAALENNDCESTSNSANTNS